MIEYKEIHPLPEVCRDCIELDCYNCDNAGDRFVLSERDKIKISMVIKKKQILRHKNDKRMRHYVEDWIKQYKDLERTLKNYDNEVDKK